MLDTAIQKLVEQAPWAAAMLGMLWMVLRYAERTHDKMLASEKEERLERTISAAEKSKQDRESQQIIAKTYADAINSLVNAIRDSTTRTSDSIKDMKDTLVEQYKNMGITQDLLGMARKELSKRTGKGD